MIRIVQPEILDSISPDDPRMPKLRRDLARLNFWMRNHRTIAGTLKTQSNGHMPKQIVELGAGDGTFLLQIAKQLDWKNISATLIDRQNVVAAETFAKFSQIGWQSKMLETDVFDWPHGKSDAVIANLFLHHFENARLAQLLDKISRRTDFFIAVEPQRFRSATLFKPLFFALGCHAITRHDATASIRAGFTGDEISRLWPDKKNWRLAERRAGLFSHLFVAKRIS